MHTNAQIPAIRSIQYLRALAALSVVIYHSLESTVFKFPVGAAGVDTFFIISGFIMGVLLSNESIFPAQFIFDRITRIFPLYWLVTIVTFVIGVCKPKLIYNFDSSVQNLIMSLLFIPHNSLSNHATPTLVQGWTLEFEIFFYISCTLCLATMTKNRRLILILLMWSLVVVGILRRPTTTIAVFVTSPLLLEFSAGLALSIAWTTRWLPKTRYLGWVIFAMGSVALIGFNLSFLKTDFRPLNFGLPAVLIVGGALMAERAGQMPKFRFGLLLGSASYSLYLIHGLVLSVVLWKISNISVFARILACVVPAAIISVAVYRYIETPLNRFIRQCLYRLFCFQSCLVTNQSKDIRIDLLPMEVSLKRTKCEKREQ